MKSKYYLSLFTVIVFVLLPFMSMAENLTGKIPTEEKISQLAHESMIQFAKAINEDSFETFYSYISELWQKQISPQELKQVFQSIIDAEVDFLPTLNKHQPNFLTAPVIDEQGVLRIEGYYPKNRFRLIFNLSYIEEQLNWKLLGINVRLMPSGAPGELPANQKIMKLTENSMKHFGKSIKTADFEFFYSNISELWQNQVSVEALNKAFEHLIAKQEQVTKNLESKPELHAKPIVNENGILQIEGSYLGEKTRLLFELDYIFEQNNWKLIGINIRLIDRISDEKIPNDEQLVGLTEESMLTFATCVVEKDFSKLYSYISEFWAQQTSKQQLNKAFGEFITQNINLLPALEVYEPVFDLEPYINHEGVLIIQGHYPTEPSKVIFELNYMLENDTWKLIGINVQIR